MKTILEEAKENCEYNQDSLRQYDKHFIEAFKDGAEFAQQWIKVENETPLAYETGEWDGKRSDFVLAKNKWGNVFIARTYEGIIDGNKFCDFAERDDTMLSHITEWRPIERS